MSKAINHIATLCDSRIFGARQGITIDEADRYIDNWKVWEETFSSHTLEYVLENISISDIAAVRYVPQDSPEQEYYDMHYLRETIEKSHRFDEYLRNTNFHREVYLPAIGYRVPYKYQTVTLSKIYKNALIQEFPYLKDYKFESFVPSYIEGIEEIYIKLSYIDGYNAKQTVSLYTPIKALKEKDSQQIFDRHWNYNTNYYRNNPTYREKIIGVLSSYAYHRLREQVDGCLYNFTGEFA